VGAVGKKKKHPRLGTRNPGGRTELLTLQPAERTKTEGTLSPSAGGKGKTRVADPKEEPRRLLEEEAEVIEKKTEITVRRESVFGLRSLPVPTDLLRKGVAAERGFGFL